MKLTVRRAAAADLPVLLQIFDNARVFMRPMATRTSGRTATPARAPDAEIERGVCYVVMGEGPYRPCSA
ncbi:MAG: hypothetical protein ACLURG_06790 [Gemmiger sp.]